MRGASDPFHDGEHAAQRLAGVQLRGAPILDRMTEQHRAFFAQLPLMFVAVLDEAGWPVGTVLTGAPGFVSSADGQVLQVLGLPAEGDPARGGVRAGAGAGLLGIEFGTRRRNRLNGSVLAVDGEGFSVGVRQSFGNCPQYIQAREVVGTGPVGGGDVERLGELDAAARELIGGADTLFVASGSGAVGGAAGGLDMSHRGGLPGFVRVEGDLLTIPDFRGNRYFNTLGNLLLNPRAGLLFVDFESGETLQVQGVAELDWEGGPASGFVGAERLWRVRVTAAWRRRGALGLRWAFRGYAPTTERLGAWAGS